MLWGSPEREKCPRKGFSLVWKNPVGKRQRQRCWIQAAHNEIFVGEQAVSLQPVHRVFVTFRSWSLIPFCLVTWICLSTWCWMGCWWWRERTVLFPWRSPGSRQHSELLILRHEGSPPFQFNFLSVQLLFPFPGKGRAVVPYRGGSLLLADGKYSHIYPPFPPPWMMMGTAVWEQWDGNRSARYFGCWLWSPGSHLSIWSEERNG